MVDILTLRTEYETVGIDIPDLDPDPFRQFHRWLDDALTAELPEPHAMVVSTVDERGRPSSRAILLRELDERGFVFYTNYESAKARHLAANPMAALCFVWLQLYRQVRVEGVVEKVAEDVSDAYFAIRPRPSQIGAHASPQSTVIADRTVLERKVEYLERAFLDGDVPRPAHWGGYRVIPEMFEFWQGRTGRLHDRIRYRPEGNAWVRERLAP